MVSDTVKKFSGSQFLSHVSNQRSKIWDTSDESPLLIDQAHDRKK